MKKRSLPWPEAAGVETRGSATPLTPALSPLRGEGARRTRGDSHAIVAAFDVSRRLLYKTVNAATRLRNPIAHIATPSPLNGERAGVRGENGVVRPQFQTRAPRLSRTLIAFLFLAIALVSASAAPRSLILQSVTAAAGQEVSISVRSVSIGDENAMGFSLSYDPALLSYRGETLGAAGIGSSLMVNTNQAASGKVGFVLARPVGQQFAAGIGELLRLRFRAATNLTSTGVSFADLPVARETVDINAVALATTYTNGAVTITPLTAPSLVSSPTGLTVYSGTNVMLSTIVSGSTPMQFQWRVNGTNIPGATNTVLQPADCTAAPNGLVGWWSGDNGAGDAMGVYHGSFNNGASVAPGVVGMAFNLD